MHVTVMTVLDAVYVDGRAKTVVSIRPKAAFRALFELGSGRIAVRASGLVISGTPAAQTVDAQA